MTAAESGWPPVSEIGQGLRVIGPDDLTEQERRDLRAIDLRNRMTSGASFILDRPAMATPVWGQGPEVLWAQGEGLILTGTPGVGKTTVAQQIVLARMGLRSHVLGFPVAPTGSRVLYLAMDRPDQIGRSFQRMVTEADRDALTRSLVVWRGPPPEDIARKPHTLMDLAYAAGADTVVVDSLKDAALGLVSDEVGAAINRAMQGCLVEGVETLTLHHQTKRSGNGAGGKPTALADVYGSGWITAGAGSVVLLAGDAGDSLVTLHHLKPVVDEVGPLRVQHDHTTGTTRHAEETVDPLAWLRAQRDSQTANHLALALAGPDQDTDRKDVERARRHLDRLVKAGLVVKEPGVTGGPGGRTPDRYKAATHPGQGNLLEQQP